MKIYECYKETGLEKISKEFIDKFLKVFDYKDDDTYCEINYSSGFIDFADMFIGEMFLDDCIKKGLYKEKAIDFYWKQLEEYEAKN